VARAAGPGAPRDAATVPAGILTIGGARGFHLAEVAFDEVTKRFGDVVAVDSLSLQIHDGEFMVLLGPSGCGKTTALRMIAGLESVSAGTVRIGDRPVNDVEPKDRDVSMVFQSYALYPHMTVARNIESPLLARKVVGPDGGPPRKLGKIERRERVEAAATSLGLDELLDRKPAALSGGQRQRVALARAIVNRPSAFLMDEPLSNLDAKLRAHTRLELVDLHRRLGTTFVYVTHDQVEAMTMADRIALLDGGRLQQVGRPQDVYAKPRNLFVARFLGSPPMNTLPAMVVEGGRDGTIWAAVGEAGRVPLDEATAPAPGSSVVLGARPEHLEPVGPDDADHEEGDGITATITGVEWLGHEQHVVVSVAGTPVMVRQPADAPAVKLGATIRLRVRPGDLHLFDPDTTERIE
jgi:multiple sugar transport system ATP-binding protein